MATGNATDFAYFDYTDDAGGHWQVKTDKDWGALAAAGFSARDATKPVWPHSKRYRTRKAILQDAVSGRTTARPTGTALAAANIAGASVDLVVKGAGGVVTFTSLGLQPEKRPKAHAIISHPEPISH